MKNQIINSNGLIYDATTSCASYSTLEHVYMWESPDYMHTPKNDPLLGALEDSSIAQYLQELNWMPQHITELFVPGNLQLS